jgi:hypothetical protein
MMCKFRFFVHTWSPITGHADRRIVIRGESMESALAMMTRKIEAEQPGVIVNPKTYERI